MARAALFFDLDGTLIDSDPLHARIFIELFAERGREIDEAFYVDRIHGRHNTDIFAEHMPGEDAWALHLEKEARFRAVLGAAVPPVRGAAELIARARAAGWGLAVVTNAPRLNADAMLAALGLGAAFDAVVVGEECAAGKPDPAPYLAALAHFGLAPERALAFEDSPSGLAAARAAGIRTLGLRSSLSHDALTAAGAADTLADFADPGLMPHLDGLSRAAA